MVGFTVRQEHQQYCNGMHALRFGESIFVKAFVDGTKPCFLTFIPEIEALSRHHDRARSFGMKIPIFRWE